MCVCVTTLCVCVCAGLQVAMQLGHMMCCKVLLEESEVNLLSLNMRGQTCLHLLAKYGRDNSAAIFSLLLSIAPGFPLDKQDEDGHTRKQATSN